MRVLVADPLSDAGLEILRKNGFDVVVKTGLKEDELAKALVDVDALLVRSGVQVTRKVLEAANKLRVVGRAGVGVDNVDAAAATERGVLVMNTPMGNTMSAAEHTWALILSAARKVPAAHATLRGGQWDRKSFKGTELHGKTLSLVGLGRIGREVATRGRAFGMRVLAYDPFISKEVAKEAGIELADLERVIREGDIITIHTPLTDETKGIISRQRIAAMKKGTILLNVARGGLVDEDAVVDALTSGHLAGAAFDVFAEEPPKNTKLLQHANFVGTPHLGASTAEAQEKVALQIAEQVVDYLTAGRITNAVNLPRPLDPSLQPLADLAFGMGVFAAQLAAGNPETVTVTCRGALAKHDTHPVAAAALAGVMSRSTEGTNLINAELRARDHGIKFVQTKTETAEDYSTSVEVVLQAAGGETRMLGTHLARLGPRIVEVNGYEVEFKPYGRFLVIQHQDQPGTIAKISSVLGRENVNIAQMVVGRLRARGPAVSILRVDDPVLDKVLDELRRSLATPSVRFIAVPRPGARGPDDEAAATVKARA